MKRTLLINLFAEPGAGKSTLAAGLFFEMKMAGIDCELVREYAKEVVWAEDYHLLKNQLHILREQCDRLDIVMGKVDVVVTDSPLLLSAHYGKDLNKDLLGMLAMTAKDNTDFDVINFFVNRVKPYNPNGRMQTEQQAQAVKASIHSILKEHGIAIVDINGDRDGLQTMLGYVLAHMEGKTDNV